MSDVIMKVLEEVADMHINLGSKSGRLFLTEKIERAIIEASAKTSN